jgi:hypothetical protein
MAVAARVEAVSFVAALITTFEMAPEGRRAAQLDGGHHTSLCRRHRRAMLFSIRFAITAENIRHFQLRAIHGAGA